MCGGSNEGLPEHPNSEKLARVNRPLHLEYAFKLPLDRRLRRSCLYHQVSMYNC